MVSALPLDTAAVIASAAVSSSSTMPQSFSWSTTTTCVQHTVLGGGCSPVHNNVAHFQQSNSFQLNVVENCCSLDGAPAVCTHLGAQASPRQTPLLRCGMHNTYATSSHAIGTTWLQSLQHTPHGRSGTGSLCFAWPALSQQVHMVATGRVSAVLDLALLTSRLSPGWSFRARSAAREGNTSLSSSGEKSPCRS